ncbi:hypothetical protein F9C07_2168128 [Aspergillus flavus]|uniref:Uncharacterized protein n=2 Tax=Aspergillus flavus TaxID=5059 RepID=A0A7U2R2I5_ASPFN|nr:hypothetical protein BDV35DRAFT_363724 [Aspergillus flavus]QRD93746.1 hypothetical protein F9C07_2168128 [Aspergillus flavus]
MGYDALHFDLRYTDDQNWRYYDMDKRWCSGLVIIYDTLSFCVFVSCDLIIFSHLGIRRRLLSYIILFALGGLMTLIILGGCYFSCNGFSWYLRRIGSSVSQAWRLAGLIYCTLYSPFLYLYSW